MVEQRYLECIKINIIDAHKLHITNCISKMVVRCYFFSSFGSYFTHVSCFIFRVYMSVCILCMMYLYSCIDDENDDYHLHGREKKVSEFPCSVCIVEGGRRLEHHKK